MIEVQIRVSVLEIVRIHETIRKQFGCLACLEIQLWSRVKSM